MNFPKEIKNQFGGKPYINIGDETCAFFCPASIHLMKQFQKFPLLYEAVIEGVKCAKYGYYASGILVFSQLLKQYSQKEPEERHLVAHSLLKQPPNKQNYQNVRLMLINKAEKD